MWKFVNKGVFTTSFLAQECRPSLPTLHSRFSVLVPDLINKSISTVWQPRWLKKICNFTEIICTTSRGWSGPPLYIFPSPTPQTSFPLAPPPRMTPPRPHRGAGLDSLPPLDDGGVPPRPGTTPDNGGGRTVVPSAPKHPPPSCASTGSHVPPVTVTICGRMFMFSLICKHEGGVLRAVKCHKGVVCARVERMTWPHVCVGGGVRPRPLCLEAKGTQPARGGHHRFHPFYSVFP